MSCSPADAEPTQVPDNNDFKPIAVISERQFLPTKFYAVLYWLLSALAGLLILVPRNLPFHDLANHLARYYVLTRDANLPQTQDLYSVHFGLTPNLGVDIIATVLGRFMPAEFVVKGLLFVGLVAWTLGCYLLSVNRNSGRCSPIAFLAPMLFFNVSVLMGYLNFAFTASLIPIIFYCYERIESPKRKIFFLSLTVLLTYFGHMLASLLILALLFFQGFQQRKSMDGRTTMISATVMTLVIGFLFKVGSVASETKQWRFTDIGNKLWLMRTSFGIGPTLYTFANIFYAFLLLCFCIRLVKVKRNDFYVLLFIAFLYAICPFGLELVMNLDGRIIPLGLAFLVSFAVWRGGQTKVTELVGTTVCFALSLGFLYPIFKLVRDGNVEGNKVREMAKMLEPGALLVTVDVNMESAYERSLWDPGLRMISYYAMCEKQVIMPGIYMFATQQPITVRPGNPILDFVATEGERRNDLDQIERSLNKIEAAMFESRSFKGKPVYILLVNHNRTGFPETYRLKYLDQDNCIALAKVDGIVDKSKL